MTRAHTGCEGHTGSGLLTELAFFSPWIHVSHDWSQVSLLRSLIFTEFLSICSQKCLHCTLVWLGVLPLRRNGQEASPEQRFMQRHDNQPLAGRVIGVQATRTPQGARNVLGWLTLMPLQRVVYRHVSEINELLVMGQRSWSIEHESLFLNFVFKDHALVEYWIHSIGQNWYPMLHRPIYPPLYLSLVKSGKAFSS